MALAPGTRIAAYEILALVGSGGMGEALPIRGWQRGDAERGWSTDGRLYVAAAVQNSFRIDRLDPFTGTRTAFREMPQSAIVGVRLVAPFITPDGATHAYAYLTQAADLYVVSGIR